jgi:Protein of unknown function (DUF3102)
MTEVTTTSAPLSRSADVIAPNDLANRINAEHEEVKNSIRRGAEHAIKAGHLLLQAKTTVGHGAFLEWIGEHCHCTVRSAQLYMKLAKNEAELRSNTKSISYLSLTEAIEMLGPLKQELPKEKSGGTSKKDPVAEAIKENALAVLQRAWQVAGEPQRKMFMRQINPPPSAS